jgi:hypothetical protein
MLKKCKKSNRTGILRIKECNEILKNVGFEYTLTLNKR